MSVHGEIPMCQLCAEPILAGEALSMVVINGQHVHHECGFRAVVGGANHIRRLCSCFGGTVSSDPEGMSMRDAAREALKAWREVNGV